MKSLHACCTNDHVDDSRRTALKMALGVTAAAAMFAGTSSVAYAEALTQAQRDAMTPEQVLAQLKAGNQRFLTGQAQEHDYLAQKRASASGQFPAAVILSCIDSRAPAEILLDTGIGEAFNARIAGNIANSDLIGSLEFACAAAGAKVVLVMGHTACGAVRGAIDGVKLGSLSGLLDKIKPAIAATQYNGDRTGKNDAFVDAVATSNVLHTISELRNGSEVLANLEKSGAIKIVGSMYDLKTGVVTFIS